MDTIISAELITKTIMIVGCLVFAVMVVTEVFKGVSFLKKIPTDALVLVLSIGLTLISFLAYMQYVNMKIMWYMIIAAILVGFVVAFVAMYGWEKLRDLWNRFGGSDGGPEGKED